MKSIKTSFLSLTLLLCASVSRAQDAVHVNEMAHKMMEFVEETVTACQNWFDKDGINKNDTTSWSQHIAFLEQRAQALETTIVAELKTIIAQLESAESGIADHAECEALKLVDQLLAMAQTHLKQIIATMKDTKNKTKGILMAKALKLQIDLFDQKYLEFSARLDELLSKLQHLQLADSIAKIVAIKTALDKFHEHQKVEMSVAKQGEITLIIVKKLKRG